MHPTKVLQGVTMLAEDAQLPLGCTMSDLGHLVYGGCDLVDLAERYGTPLYVFNEALIRERCQAYRRAFRSYPGGADVAYAGKAVLTLALARIMQQEGMFLDVVSGGELYVALRAGFPAERVVLHGNNKSRSEIEAAVCHDVGRIVVDNFHELELMQAAAAARGRPQPVMLRVAPGIEAHTHDYIRTGSQASKFGFDLQSGQALEAIRAVSGTPWLTLLGLHAHIGSQILDVAWVVPLVEAVLDLTVAAQGMLRGPLTDLNLGGGAGIRYTDERALPPDDVAAALGDAVQHGCAARGLPLPRLVVEPGRSIVGEAGIALYRVGSQKRVPGLVPYVSVDGGMGDNIRPALYGAEYRILLANRVPPPGAPQEPVHVVGRYCESGDFLAREVPLPPLQAGDLLAVPSSGAYQYPMASNYNLVPRPCVVLVAGGEVHVMVERETYADLVARDRIPPHLATPPIGL